jgi:hypothetical protein
MTFKQWAIKYRLCKFWQWVLFGKITSRNIDRIDWIVTEIEYRGRFNRVVGYWAYGYFDPSLPYQGPCEYGALK